MSRRGSRTPLVGTMEANFTGNTRTIAPVQTQDDGWLNYLSEKEQQKLGHAEKHAQRGVYMMLGALALGQGPKLIFGLTLGTSFCWLIGAGVGLYAAGKWAVNLYRVSALVNEAERREGEFEVRQRRGVAPRTRRL